MRQALDEREELIAQRATEVLDTALTDRAPWAAYLGSPPAEEKQATHWRAAVRVVAAYRDRYRIDSDTPLGPEPSRYAQMIDAARAIAALRQTQHLTMHRQPRQEPRRQTSQRRGPGL